MKRPALRIGAWILAVSLAAAISLRASDDGDKPAKPAPVKKAAPVKPLRLGDRAVDFALPGVDGKTWRLKNFATADVLVVVFTCNHCPTAQLYEDRIARVARDYRKRGVALVAISPNDPLAVRPDELGYTDLGDSFEDMKIRAKAKKFPFPYLYDGATQKTSRAYGPRVTPQAFVFDAERRLRYSGRVDNSESGKKITRRDLRTAIDSVLAGKPVEVATTRAFGCSVKWSDKRAAAAAWLKKAAAEKVTIEMLSARGVRELRQNKTKKLRLINVWATWCGPCVAEMPDLVHTNRMYRHRAFEFATISIDLPDQSKEVQPVLRKLGVSGRHFVFDSEDRDPLAEALDPQWSGAVPLTILVAPGGEIVYRHEGRIDPLQLRRTIVKNLAAWRE